MSPNYNLGSEGFGLRLKGEKSVLVDGLTQARDELMVGDQILEINRRVVKDQGSQNAVDIIEARKTELEKLKSQMENCGRLGHDFLNLTSLQDHKRSPEGKNEKLCALVKSVNITVKNDEVTFIIEECL